MALTLLPESSARLTVNAVHAGTSRARATSRSPAGSFAPSVALTSASACASSALALGCAELFDDHLAPSTSRGRRLQRTACADRIERRNVPRASA